MEADRWAHIAAIVEEAIALPAESRPAYLRTACDHDADLGRQVASLLIHHQEEEALRTASSTAARPPEVSFAEMTAQWRDDRFEGLACLGTGGFGNVYRAYDRVRHQWVALKVLRHVDPIQLDRFKQEFRKTTTITHPNVVQLYELFASDDHWFFTMELIEGQPILDHIRGPGPWTTEVLTAAAWQRLYQTFEQLVEGVSALHAAGIVHGDLKPQNVLVSTAGRVVLLDFGLVRDIAQQPSLVAGTPAYMAPEQLTQAPVAEAADWYSVGVLLYEALTTRVPFTGTFWDMLWKKQTEEVRLPETTQLPEPIVSLCHALLHRHPDQRPSGREILERLVGRCAEEPARVPPDPQRLFVGRHHQLDALQDAFDRMRLGHPTSVHVQGVSGIGKSALVRHFLDTIRREHEDAVVLVGRCYESESVPFKALDELVDGLSRYLGQLEAADVDALLPRDLPLLTRVFPALRKVPSIGRERDRADAPGAQDRRDRALAALGELLERLAARKPVILWIDDLQWGDFDSLRVLRDLQQPTGAPCLLLILSYRSEDVGSSPVLQAVAASASDGHDTVRALTLNALPHDEAHALAAALCDGLPEADRTSLIHEAAGSPLFLHELARHMTTRRTSAERAPSLTEMIQQRVQRLPSSSRRLLNVIAVAGQPLARQMALQAADPDDAGAESQLLGEFLIRASRSTATGEWDIYHETVREAVLGLMSEEERRADHGRLARTLEAEGTADPERLVHHFTKAGIEDAAYRCALQAASVAENCLAFDQAAALYRLALDLQTRISSSPGQGLDHLHAGELWRKLARALADAGRSAEAARAYVEAAERSRVRETDELRSLAVDQLMRSGQINEGMRLLTATLRARGMLMPDRRGAVLAAVVATRLRVRLRGLTFRERAAGDVAPAMLTHLDRLWTTGATLTAIDPLLASYIRGQHLLLALRAGEPSRIAVGLAFEAVQRAAMGGGKAYPTARRILDRAREIAIRCGRPYAEAMVLTGEAGVAFLSGRVMDAFRFGLQSEDILSARCTGVAWELAACRMWTLSALSLTGRWREYGLRLGAILQEAERHGDRYAQCALPLSAGCFVSYLAADDPAAARRVLDEMITQWGRTQFDVPRLSHWHGTVETLLYERRYEEAWQLVTKTWPVLRRTHILRVEFLRLLVGQLRARCAVAVYAVAPRPAVLAIAERFLRECARSSIPLVQGWGLLIDAALMVSRGRREGAIAKLQLAEERLRDAGSVQFTAASRRRRGELTGGDGGAALIRLADQELVELGAVDARRTTDRLIPGIFSPSSSAR